MGLLKHIGHNKFGLTFCISIFFGGGGDNCNTWEKLKTLLCILFSYFLCGEGWGAGGGEQGELWVMRKWRIKTTSFLLSGGSGSFYIHFGF